MAYNRYLRTGIIPGGTPRGKNGQFIPSLFRAPVFNLPGFTSSTEEAEPHRFADIHVVTNKKGGKIKKYENGAEMESDEDALYNQMNFDVNAKYDDNATDAEKVAATDKADAEALEYAKEHAKPWHSATLGGAAKAGDSISSETTWQKLSGHFNPELAANFASLAMNIGSMERPRKLVASLDTG